MNGPLLVLDQRGSISAQVQITPQHVEILAVAGGQMPEWGVLLRLISPPTPPDWDKALSRLLTPPCPAHAG